MIFKIVCFLLEVAVVVGMFILVTGMALCLFGCPSELKKKEEDNEEEEEDNEEHEEEDEEKYERSATCH